MCLTRGLLINMSARRGHSGPVVVTVTLLSRAGVTEGNVSNKERGV